MFPYILQISALVSGFIVHTLHLVSKDEILINSDVTVKTFVKLQKSSSCFFSSKLAY